MMHADAEEAVVFPVGHAPERVVFPVAMRLRTLHECDFRIGEITGERAQPVGTHDVVGIDHRHDLGTRIGFGQAEIQRAGFETRPRTEMEKAEFRAEFGTMLLDRTPHRFFLGVVVEHQHFVIVKPN